MIEVVAVLANIGFIFAVFGFAMFLFTVYPVYVESEKDWFYFLRKKQYKRKMIEKGYETSWQLLDTLLHTTEKDWEKRGNWLVYTPFQRTRIFFNNYMWKEIEILEGPGKKRVFDICYFNDSKEIGYGYDMVSGSSLKKEDEFRMKQVIFHVDRIAKNIDSAEYQREQRLKDQKEQNFNAWKKERKKELQLLIQQELPLTSGYRRYDFSFQLKKENYYTSLFISFGDTVYFQALQTGLSGEISTTIHHVESERAQIFTELEETLISFAKKALKENTSTATTKIEVLSADHDHTLFEEKYKEKLGPIYALTESLVQDETWLSHDSIYQIKETFPNDLSELKNVYRTIKEKDAVHEDIESSLHTIYEKLQSFGKEAESNKQQAIKKRKLVIEKR